MLASSIGIQFFNLLVQKKKNKKKDSIKDFIIKMCLIMKLLHANSNLSVLTVMLMLKQVILFLTNDSVRADTISHGEGV